MKCPPEQRVLLVATLSVHVHRGRGRYTARWTHLRVRVLEAPRPSNALVPPQPNTSMPYQFGRSARTDRTILPLVLQGSHQTAPGVRRRERQRVPGLKATDLIGTWCVRSRVTKRWLHCQRDSWNRGRDESSISRRVCCGLPREAGLQQPTTAYASGQPRETPLRVWSEPIPIA